MIRRIVNQLMYLLCVKNKSRKSLLEMLQELLPVIFAANIIVEAIRAFGIEIRLPWYKRAWRKLVNYIKIMRRVIVGY